jgi:hypothetical protein
MKILARSQLSAAELDATLERANLVSDRQLRLLFQRGSSPAAVVADSP